ncbi:hypothetical protein DFH09DRAFT_1133764 [Mycena vulgaris]|nr:hypothetical protein DFH09DRAFT_1133764 [Mycena vulgaris]
MDKIQRALGSGFDETKFKEFRDETTWEEFVKQALLKFPALTKYQGQWPLELYFNRWTSDRVHHKATIKPARKRRIEADDEIDDGPSKRPTTISAGRGIARDLSKDPAAAAAPRGADPGRRYFIGKDPTSNDPPPAVTTAALQVAGERRKIYYIGENPSNFRRPPRSHSHIPASPTSKPVSGHESDTDSSQRPAAKPLSEDDESDPDLRDCLCLLGVQRLNKFQTVWPMWCVHCGVPPPVVPEECIRQLCRLFKGDVLGIFATIGILHDLHLRVLATLDEAHRRKFLLSFVPGKFSQFEACQVSEILGAYAKKHAGEDEFPGGEIEVCSRHQAQYAVEVPSELRLLLATLGMEELGPAAVFLGIDSNKKFQTMRTFDSEMKRKMIFESLKGIKPSPFQILMLEIALAPAS